MRYLALTFLGGFHVTLDEVTITNFGSDKARALLAYLALENNRPHRRTALAAMLWPDLSEKKAAHNLSQTILRLRTALVDVQANGNTHEPPFLLVESQQVRLNPRASIHTDVDIFRSLMLTCSQHHAKDPFAINNCPDCIGWMRDAARLYNGDLLAGFFVRNSPAIEQWRLVQQEALQMQIVDVLGRLANYHEKRGEYEQVQHYAHRLTVLDPWCEDAHLQLMRALAARGQTSAALEHFDFYRRLLVEELGIEPSQAAANLYQHVRLGEILPPNDVSAAQAGQTPSVQPEIRQITTLVCGRCMRSPQADPEAQYNQMKECRLACARVINRYGGFFAQRQGNECVVYYGYPLAYEDSARRAVHAALAMVGNNHDDPVRVSVHTGCMVLGEKRGRRAQDRELVGDAPNLARLMLQQTPPGRVTISPNTQRLVQGWFELLPEDGLIHPGDKGSISMRQVEECGDRDPFDWLEQHAQLTPFVGRETELRQLTACLEVVNATASGDMVILRGDPGIGKSRLIWEWKQHTLRDPAISPKAPLWLSASCTQYDQNRSLFPVVRILEQLLGIDPRDCQEIREQKAADGLARAFPERPSPVRLLTTLLRLPYDPTTTQPTMQMRDLLQAAYVRLLQQLAAEQPLVIVIEDLQWSDTDTIAWLGRASEFLENTPCLLVLTARSGFDPPWLSQQRVTHIDLAPLQPGEAAVLVACAATMGIPAAQVESILARADGVPLYLEALARATCDEDESHSACPPPILRDLLASRIDYLGPAKVTAQWAAMIGRRFSRMALQAASGINPVRLQHDLETMIATGIIESLDSPGSEEYIFHHALVQEAAAASLLKSARAEYETRIAQVLQPA